MKDFPRPGVDTPIEPTRLLVLSEGLYNMNNSTLALVDLNDGTTDYDIFSTLNHRGIGDTANDIKRYGSKIYIPVNISSTLEIIDAHSLISIKQIPLASENGVARQPRRIAFHDGFAYLTCFDGTLIEIDTLSLETTRMVTLGRNPDHIAICNDKAYVSNSGGLDYPYYDATVSVVDLASMAETRRIQVGQNPGCIEASENGDIYVASRGDYGLNDYTLHKIDTEIDTVISTFSDIHPLNFCIVGNTLFMYNYNFSDASHWVKSFDCATDKIINDNLLPENVSLTTPFSITVDPSSGEIFLTDANSFILFGHLICINSDGTLRYIISEIGLNPNGILIL